LFVQGPVTYRPFLFFISKIGVMIFFEKLRSNFIEHILPEISMKSGISAIASVFFTFVLTTNLQATDVPANSLHLQDNLVSPDSNIDEPTFHQLLDKVYQVYQPIIAAHGAKLVIERRWDDPTVNAVAGRDGDVWKIRMYGGLARRPEVTPDGFQLVACHEIGHHLAGYPLKSGYWSASEGQADYFATQSCARELWRDDIEVNKAARNEVDPLGKSYCDQIWSTEAERDLCYRIVVAAISANRYRAKATEKPDPSIDTPNRSEVPDTIPSHPEVQCRLDTGLAGALCTVPFDRLYIPGLGSPPGQNRPIDEMDAGRFSCMRANSFDVGVRPRCWFRPLVSPES
jgi:hypothetical protein